MVDTIFPGITSSRVETPRLTANVLERPSDAATTTVLLVHGNTSSSLFWQPLMLDLPHDVRALAVDLRGFGDSDTLPVDATRGVRDFSDDVASVIDELDLGAVHVVGWSLGGGVTMQLLLDRPELVASLTLVAPVSPYGFGGTAADGSLLTPDAAGTGGGGANPDFIDRLARGDRSDEPGSPRAVFRATYVAPGYQSEHEDIWVESMLTTKTGIDNDPGDSTPLRELARLRPGWPWRAQHPGADALQHHGDRRPRAEAADPLDPRCAGRDRGRRLVLRPQPAREGRHHPGVARR